MLQSNPPKGIWYWNVPKFILGAAFIFFLIIILVNGIDESSLRELIRWSARFSFLLFILAFSASSIHNIFRNSMSWWLRMNRKFIGISFATIHIIHLLFICILQVTFHPVFNKAALGSLIGGGIAYFFVFSMLLTSFEKFKKLISPVSWKLLHTMGSYWIWSIFMTTYFKRTDTEPIHWVLVFVLIVILILQVRKYFISFKIHLSIYIILILVLSFTSCAQETAIEGRFLIENGTVVDGSGRPSYSADIVIDNDSIVWIGNATNAVVLVDSVINAAGKIVSPGFIDIHSHGNPLQTPEFLNFLSMGVTSIALGMDGSSVKVSQLERWMNHVDSIRTGVNIIPFFGHGTIRNESGIGVSTEPSQDQIQKMKVFAEQAMNLGCWGMSMGLEYHPGYFAGREELQSLAKVIGEYDGLITSHIRSEDDEKIMSSLNEMRDLTQFCNVNISHIKSVYGKGAERADEILELLGTSVNNTYNFTADLYPYLASYTGIGIVFPNWAKVPKQYEQIKKKRSEELLNFLRNKVYSRNGPGATLFGNGPYKGKTLADLETEYNLPFEVILKDIIGPYGTSAAFFVMNEELQNQLMRSDLVMIASDGSPTMHHPRGHGTFSKVIEKYVVKDSLLSLEEAIYKMSKFPAATLGLDDYGTIEIGNKADLVIFDPKNVRARASFDEPYQLSEGMDIVLLSGRIAWSSNGNIHRLGGIVKKPQSRS